MRRAYPVVVRPEERFCYIRKVDSWTCAMTGKRGHARIVSRPMAASVRWASRGDVALAPQWDGGTAQSALEQRQLAKLNRLIDEILPANAFYRRKLHGVVEFPLRALEDFRRIPFTTKQELVEDQAQHPLFGTDLTFPLERYVRVHQTSGTSGRPLYWLDTDDSWSWWADCWRTVFEAAGVGARDRIFFPFSFGPFIGFWSGWEGARRLGALAVSGGRAVHAAAAQDDGRVWRDGARVHAHLRSPHGGGGLRVGLRSGTALPRSGHDSRG